MKTVLETSVTVERANALHARVAATIVKLAAEATDTQGTRFFMRHGDRTVPAENLLALLSLGVRRGDAVTLLCEIGPDVPVAEAEAALNQIRNVVAQAGNSGRAAEADPVDAIIYEATVTLDRVVENLVNGLVVVNANNEIILLNKAAERYLNLSAASVLGRRADEVIPNSRLAHVLRTGRPETACRQSAGGITLLTNRTPIWIDDRIVGAAAVFQDMSDLERVAEELREVKALREQFYLLVDSLQEGVCLVAQDGTITYANPAFRKLFGDPPRWSSDGPLGRAIRTMCPAMGKVEVTPSGERIIEDVHVIRIDNEVHGAIAICRSADVVRDLARRLEQEEARANYLEAELVRSRPLTPPFARIIGRSGTLRDALAMAAKAAPSSTTILIRGESGTGKELVAEAIHESSPRAKKPLVRLNCSAIPPTLVESELFGHERGAFTGAIRRRQGKFELAHGGTIFLDEIGSLELPLQAKLLRVLQNRVLERVGGEESIPIDVRVIAATNADLEQLVEQGQFREDLYYRLNVIGIYLPPLRDRGSDIPLLVEHFIAKLSSKVGRTVVGITPDALRLLMVYDWPGNVRQLENVIERAVNLCEGNYITVGDLPPYLTHPNAVAPALVSGLPGGEVATLEAYEKEIIKLALERHGSFNAAAKALGVTHRTVALKARRYGLVPSASD